ncbi:alginate export family protein [Glaciecola petra]|uniref:Alginate export family protein n=1 Tax=Glaciecola petra TaxID=3075602 RepID=A0ABU2ZST1_9ALTE|nr:alginate export family protein [Aestuariibacter sp. P117]MDT0595696.1 alginate export family protein [Aestuariibacter sp. P117]
MLNIFKKQFKIPVSATAVCCIASSLVAFESRADSIHEALADGKAMVDFRFRYEGVEQDNALSDADALTFRTRVGYKSGSYEGFSFMVELEDNRIALGQDDFTVGPAGFNPGIYSVIADPEFTELDQGYLQYKKDAVTVKLGRQVIALDGQRFIGHVGWRQDRQTFDAATVIVKPSKELSVQYSYIDQRNRIFGEFADLDAKDHLLNVSYATEMGKLTAYAYLLEVDNGVPNALDTYGASFQGSMKLDDAAISYHAEYATQTSETSTTDFSAGYLSLQVGATISGITAKLGYESLGSDEGQFGFATPLATLHKFNGWSDQFLGTPAQGLVDTSFSLSGKGLGGKWLAVYHQFDADEATATIDDLGSEINVQYTTTFAKKYGFGIKYAAYSGESGRVDADKLWLWLSTKF